MANFTKYVAPTANFFSTTLNGGITDSADTITLNSTTNLQAPGYLVIDREDGSGTATPSAREVVYFTGISGSDITGVTRGADSSTAQSHSDGALVESTITVGVWNSLVTVVDQSMDDNGMLRSVVSPLSITNAHLTNVYASDATVTNSLNVSGASIIGFPLVPTFVFVGSLSGATTFVQTPLVMPRVGTWNYVNFVTRTVASTESIYIDLNKNGSSIFEAGTRPVIAAGGTFYSSASINVKNFARGDIFTWDLDGEDAADAHITDFNIQLIST